MKLPKKSILLLILLSLALSACTGGAATMASSWPGLTADAETAYVAYNQHVYAVSLANGSEKWRFPAEADAKINFYAAPVLTDDGQLIVGGYNNILYSLDSKTGAEKWSFKNAKNRYIGSALAGKSGIYAPNADRTLYALDSQGALRWSFQTGGEQWTQPAADPDCDCIYLPSMDHRIYAINSQDGQAKWKSEDVGGAIVGTPAYAPDGTLFVGTFNNEMLAIAAENGQTRWRVPTDGWVWGGPAFKDGTLYFGDLKGAFYALDAATGKILWKIAPDGPIAQTPLMDEESIYFATEAGSLYALDYNGNIRWNTAIGGKLHSSPVLAGEKILVSPTGIDQILVALDLNGSQLWQFIPEKK